MEKSANSTVYEPLPADGTQIRLVTVFPGEVSEKLRCTVGNYPFAEDEANSLEYEALSYVWGNATITTPISLNDQPFEVTINLKTALCALRFRDRKRLIWIDAICINQTNIPERNQEVRRMAKIYSNAKLVVVWLGREVEPGDTAVTGDRIADRTHKLLDALADADPEVPDAAARVFEQTGNAASAIRLLHRFFFRSWFARIWVLQEIALSKTAMIIYGDRQIGWNRLMQAVDAIRRVQQGQHTHLWRLCGAANADRVQRCWMRARANPSEDGSQISVCFELIDILWQTRFCESKEPRDRLYGILGLVKGNLQDEKLLEIDYTKPVADIFRDLNIFLIRNGMLSHVLCSVVDPMEGLPSWASTWCVALEGATASRLSAGLTMYMQIHSVKGIQAQPYLLSLSEDTRQITLKGCIFDAYGISHIGKRFDPIVSSDAGVDNMARICRSRLTAWEDEMESKQCARKIFKTKRKRREAWKCALLHELPGNKTEMGQHYDLFTDRSKPVPSGSTSALALRAVVDLNSTLGINCDYRRPFITRSGQMGSTGTNCDIHLGDKVCVFVGSAVPYVLRPIDVSEGLYRFLTCCWVSQLVELDLLDGERKGLWELQDITLV
ncbi:heterokaryon incompatibility protein-domain-containing protein [Hypomontagnella monticulosa]|nr:heterokaryon incompatibility protein-domain-containing protein [Hypomontagnella monticulosa]